MLYLNQPIEAVLTSLTLTGEAALYVVTGSRTSGDLQPQSLCLLSQPPIHSLKNLILSAGQVLHLPLPRADFCLVKPLLK